jgi:hypothetical protein
VNKLAKRFSILLRKVYNGENDVIDGSILSLVGSLIESQVVNGYGRSFAEVDFSTPDAAMLTRLTRDVWHFSAAKNYQNLRDLTLALKDENGKLVYFIRANNTEITISSDLQNIRRGEWIRVMLFWKTNKINPYIKLFINGKENNNDIVTVGENLLSNNPIIFNQNTVGNIKNKFITTNINFTDDLPFIYIGSDFAGASINPCRIDNFRILKKQKELSNIGEDIDFGNGPDTAKPVVSTDDTTLLLDFESNNDIIEFLATLLNPRGNIFTFEVEVLDPFRRVVGINNGQIEQLIIDLINIIKPAHTTAFVTFKQ